MIYRYPLTPEMAGRLQRRRISYFSIVFAFTSIGTVLMFDLLRKGGFDPLEWCILALFIPLFYHLTASLVLAMIGLYVVVRRRGNPLSLIRTLPQREEDMPAPASTAIVMPIYNEDVSRVFEGLRVIFRDLEKTGQIGAFDFFVLSDSDDTNKWVEEEAAWLELCRQLNGFGKIFYRKRRQAINRKSGNIADFCRRWGKRYRYMLVLDADSIMSGDALLKMVRLMEINPTVGILQTAPRLVNGETFFSRVFQFASRAYGPIFVAGLNYWQVGEANFWGHNAIIRLKPFIENCALPDLPGKEPFGGRILSHDFVEAALMRKAGYYVCLAPEIGGSYEEGPPTLIDHLKRDRRWCQGNMQHFWLLWAKGWSPIHRLLLAHGIMSYAASPLWFLFLIMGTFQAFSGRQPGGPEITLRALILLGFTLVLLFLPKVVSCLWVLATRERSNEFGGRTGFCISVALETLFFVVMAPIMMIFHTRFVFLTILGQGVRWVTQRRQADADWRESILTFKGVTFFGIIWGICTYIVSPHLFLWLLPVLMGLWLAVPFSIATSSVPLGQRARKAGIFVIPEESQPDWVLKQLAENIEKAHKRIRPIDELHKDYGLLLACLDPYINALHLSLLRQRKNPPPESKDYFDRIRTKLLHEGPKALSSKDKAALLYDHDSVQWLHQKLWCSAGPEIAPWWQLAIRQYNVLTAEPVTALYR